MLKFWVNIVSMPDIFSDLKNEISTENEFSNNLDLRLLLITNVCTPHHMLVNEALS